MKIRWSQHLFHILSYNVRNCSPYCTVPTVKATGRQILHSPHYFYFSNFFLLLLVNWYLLALYIFVSHFLLKPALLNLTSVSHHLTAMERCQKDHMSKLRSALSCQERWLIAVEDKVDASFGSVVPGN